MGGEISGWEKWYKLDKKRIMTISSLCIYFVHLLLNIPVQGIIISSCCSPFKAHSRLCVFCFLLKYLASLSLQSPRSFCPPTYLWNVPSFLNERLSSQRLLFQIMPLSLGTRLLFSSSLYLHICLIQLVGATFRKAYPGKQCQYS